MQVKAAQGGEKKNHSHHEKCLPNITLKNFRQFKIQNSRMF